MSDNFFFCRWVLFFLLSMINNEVKVLLTTQMRSHYPKPCLKPHFFLENIRYLEEIYLIVHWALPCHALILSHNPIDVNYVLRRSRKRNKKLHGRRKILMFMYTYSHFTFRYTCCIFSLPIVIDFGKAFIRISHFPCRSHWKSLKLPENTVH